MKDVNEEVSGPHVQDAARLLWAAAVLQVLQRESAHVLVGLCCRLPAEDYSLDALLQLFQAHMVLQALPGSTRQLPGPLVERGEAAWRCKLADARPSEVRSHASASFLAAHGDMACYSWMSDSSTLRLSKQAQNGICMPSGTSC